MKVLFFRGFRAVTGDRKKVKEYREKAFLNPVLRSEKWQTMIMTW
jgi:hypothetical protein